MILFTKTDQGKLQKQFKFGADMESQDIIIKLFSSYLEWTWYIMNQSPKNPDYLWGIVDGVAIEMGSMSKSELEDLKFKVDGIEISLERDLNFVPMAASEVWEKLNNGEHV